MLFTIACADAPCTEPLGMPPMWKCGMRALLNYKNAITLRDVAQLRIEWDEHKNLSNQRKHGVSFTEAVLVFRDPLHVSIQDRVVNGEQQWQTVGLVDGVLLLMVAHTLREEDATEEVVRIISARRATPQERRRYEDEND